MRESACRVKVTAPARLAAAQAQLDGALAKQSLADSEARRQTEAGPRATSQNAIDAAVANASSAAATVEYDRAQVEINQLVQEDIAQAKAQVDQLEARVQEAQAQLAQAELNLSYTKIYAPAAGWVTKRAVNVGDVVERNQTLTALVVGTAWVTANFKETQLTRMRPGQPVASTSTPIRPRLRGPRRQHPGRLRRALQPAAAGERDRQLREGRAARAGQDRVRRAAAIRPVSCSPGMSVVPTVDVREPGRGSRGRRPEARRRRCRRRRGRASRGRMRRTRAREPPRARASDAPLWLIALVATLATFMEVLDTASPTSRCRTSPATSAPSIDEAPGC